MSNNIDVKIILILAANPANTNRVRLDEEVREIDEGLRRSHRREEFKLEQKWAVRSRDFYRAILDYHPQIVHFCGHGAGQDGLVLEDDGGQPALIPADTLGSMFKLFASKGVECVLLNACYSLMQAEAISQYVNYVIGMNSTVGDTAAIAFAVAFYDALAAGEEVEFAYELGCSQMRGSLEQQIPVLKKKQSISVPTAPQKEFIPPNPYQGLSAFGEEDAAFFFGRETFVNGLVEAVNKQPLVAVIGPSGSGKSSVVFAGLIPQLRTQGIWLIESIRPTAQPFYQMAFALVRQLEPEIGETEKLRTAAGLAADIQQGKVTLLQVASRIIERNPDKRLLLFVDQFEELYTLCHQEEQERFADLVFQAIGHKSITLVFTLRADFYGYVLSYRPWTDALQEFTPQLLSSMSREELLAAITLPAQKLEVQLEAQLQERILDDVGLEPGNLPLLEFALTRLWSKQQNRLLTHQAYNEIGGVKQALANHAQQVYIELSQTEQKQAQRVFVQLVRPGEGTEDTRRIATRAEVGDENWELISYLAGYEARLVVTGCDEKSGEDTVEVVHEALIRKWERLREWMQIDRSFRIWQEELRFALRQWEATKRDDGALLRGVPLVKAEDWHQKRLEELSLEERVFIQISLALREREKQQREHRMRLTLLGLIGGLVITLGLAGATTWQWLQAEQGQIKTLTKSSELLFASNKHLDALVESLKAGKKLQQMYNYSFLSSLLTDIEVTTKFALQQAVYGTQERNRLEGHGKAVYSVSFSQDGKAIATGSEDGTIIIWNERGKLLKTIKGHENRVTSVSFSSDGQTLASASLDGSVKLWNYRQITEPIHSWKQKYPFSSVSFSPNSQALAIASDDGNIKLWNFTEKKEILLSGNSIKVTSVSFSPDNERLASGSEDGSITFWNPKNGTKITTLPGKIKVNSVSFSPDGTMLASANENGTVILWNPKNGKEIVTLRGNTTAAVPVNSVSFSPDSQTLASSDLDGTITIWNPKEGMIIKTLKGHSGSVNSVNFSPDDHILASGGKDNTVILWDYNKTFSEVLEAKPEAKIKVTSVSFSPDDKTNKTIASASVDGTVIIWKDNKRFKTWTAYPGNVSVKFSPDGKTLAIASAKGTLLWNYNEQDQPNDAIPDENKTVNNVSFNPTNGNIVALAMNDGTIKLWDLNKKWIIWSGHHTQAVTSVSFSPDGSMLASASADKTVKCWDLRSHKVLISYSKHKERVNSVSFSPDGKTIASASDDGTIILSRCDGMEQRPLSEHTEKVNSVSFSPDGKTIASASDDGTIILWSYSGRVLQTLSPNRGPLLDVSFSSDSKAVAAAAYDGTVILWDLDLDNLLLRGCRQANDYLSNNSTVSPEDKHICNNS